jgi:hypothetical protein
LFIATLQTGTDVTIPLVANSSGNFVNAADIELQFDTAILRAVGCVAGIDAINIQGFECRYNIQGSLDTVQISYVDSSAGVAWAPSRSNMQLFEVARVQFEVSIQLGRFVMTHSLQAASALCPVIRHKLLWHLGSGATPI